jgi:hypothetical protein
LRFIIDLEMGKPTCQIGKVLTVLQTLGVQIKLIAPATPGSIHEGGELGYSLTHAFGAAFDNPKLIVACVVGDGEAGMGPLATAWQSMAGRTCKTFLVPINVGLERSLGRSINDDTGTFFKARNDISTKLERVSFKLTPWGWPGQKVAKTTRS